MSQQVLVQNTSSGFAPIPSIYGGGSISPGKSVVVNDALATVQTAFGGDTLLRFSLVPSGQGALQPTGGGSGGALAYAPGAPASWNPAPTTVAGALDQLATARTQSGTATLAAGTKAVTGVVLTASSKIQLTRDTPAGTVGDLSAPAASRNTGTGTFVINSANAADTSTVDWTIIG